jgi:hypothetical protein
MRPEKPSSACLSHYLQASPISLSYPRNHFSLQRQSFTSNSTPIYHYISPRGKRARVTRQIKIHPLQLARIALPMHGRQFPPAGFHLWRTAARDRGADVAGADGVDAGAEGCLFGGEGFG